MSSYALKDAEEIEFVAGCDPVRLRTDQSRELIY